MCRAAKAKTFGPRYEANLGYGACRVWISSPASLKVAVSGPPITEAPKLADVVFLAGLLASNGTARGYPLAVADVVTQEIGLNVKKNQVQLLFNFSVKRLTLT